MTLQVKLTEAFQAKASQDSSALDMLQKVAFRKQGGGGAAGFSGYMQVSAGVWLSQAGSEVPS